MGVQYNFMETRNINYPYLPEDRTILYVPEDNVYMVLAKENAKKHRSNLTQSHCAVLVKNNKVIGLGAIGNNPVHIKGCLRVSLNVPTGTGYDLCEGCSPKFHSEQSAIRDAKAKGNDLKGADLYFWGHWWCCESCWNTMIQAGIRNVYILEHGETLFNKEHPHNIIGKQFNYYGT